MIPDSSVAVVILNWNGQKHLEQFLPSVIRHTPQQVQIIVADNASTDNSVLFLKENYPQIAIIQNSFNGGFSQGYNKALEKVKASYYILLNSDVEVTEDWIEPVISLMEQDKTIAVAQSKIKSFLNKKEFEHAGAAGGFIDKHGFPFCRGRIFDVTEEDNGQYDLTGEIFWASGACLFVRSELYHKAGGLDEDFFAHMEEIDLCWRLKNMGYKIMYTSNSEVYHLGGGTLSYKSPYKTFLNFRNNLYMILKNRPSQYLYFNIFFRLILDGIAAIKFLLGGEFLLFKATWEAHLSFYKNFARIKKKRQKHIPYPHPEIYPKSIIVEYFLKKKKKFSELEWRD